MCGICGFSAGWDEAALGRMQARIRHRGPDDEGAFFDPKSGVGLAQTRLSIVDLAGGRQPLTNEDGSVVVVFNGEIYNHEALRADLLARGHRLANRSDGEVIAHLYEDEGIEFVQRLRGMFAIALFDARKGSLFLIRDRFGIKPLYLRAGRGGVAFASEAKALLALDPVRDVDPQALAWYLAFRYVPEERTLFAGIEKLRPGHWMEIGQAGTRTRRYYDLRTVVPAERSERDWVEELRARLEEAVRLRLMSDVPLGAFLSGGLDSSFIVALMAGMMDRPVETFSFGVGSGWHDESEHAAVVAAAFGTNHHRLGGDCDAPDLLRRVVWHLDEPLADTAVLPTYLLSALTRQHVTVALTGEGADELLGGYDKYKALALGDRVGRRLPGALLGRTGDLLARWPMAHRALRSLGQGADRARAYMELVAVFNAAETRQLLTPGLGREVAAAEPADAVIGRVLAGCRGPTYLDDLFQVDLATWLVDDVLLKADKMSMAHGLEARVPFLDHPFAEFCMAMPASLKLRGLREKHVLREAMRGRVPDRIVERRKHGFTVSLKPWLREGGIVERTLGEDVVRRRGWFEPAVVRRLLGADPDHAYVRRQLFALVMLETWAQVFLDGDVPEGVAA